MVKNQNGNWIEDGVVTVHLIFIKRLFLNFFLLFLIFKSEKTIFYIRTLTLLLLFHIPKKAPMRNAYSLPYGIFVRFKQKTPSNIYQN
jgi:hypothetical protein